jgi:hypothetical protein
MYVHQLPTDSTKMAAALERATADLPPLRAAVARAEEQVVTCRMEVSRLTSKTATMRQQMNMLFEQCRKLKADAMAAQAMDDEAAAKRAWTDQGSTRVAYARCRDSVSYLVSWIAPDADLRLLEAELAERTAVANLHDALAAQKRAAMLLAMGPATEADPGVSLNVAGTQSQQLLDRAVAIRRDEIPRIEAAIRQHKIRVAAERDAVAPGLFQVAA